MFLTFQQGAVWNIKLYNLYGYLFVHLCTVNDCSMEEQALFYNLQGHFTDDAQQTFGLFYQHKAKSIPSFSNFHTSVITQVISSDFPHALWKICFFFFGFLAQ